MASAATDGGLRGLSVMTVSSVCTPYLWCGQTPPWPPSTPPSAPPSTLGGGSAFFTPHLSWGTLADRAMLSTDAGVHPLSAAVQRGSHAKRPCSLCRTCSHGRYALPYALVCGLMRLYALVCAYMRSHTPHGGAWSAATAVAAQDGPRMPQEDPKMAHERSESLNACHRDPGAASLICEITRNLPRPPQ